MENIQETDTEGLLYACLDELSMFLSIFERGQNAGSSHSIDKSRFLTL